MAGVYVFDYNDVDLDTTGLVGDLQPLECTFDEQKNGESLLTMQLCYDPLDKWKAVKVGNYIKALVPVRVPPKIVNHQYAQEVMTYKVKSSVTAYAYVWESSGEVERPSVNPMINPYLVYRTANTKKKVKVKRRIKAGATVQVLEQYDDGRCKVYVPGVGSGWTLIDNLEQDVSHTIPATFAGVESTVTAPRLAYQLFQVTTVEQTLDSVHVKANHVFYELANTYTSYKSTWPVEAHNAIDGVFAGLVSPEDRFTCLTDATHKAGALDYDRVNVVQALLDPEYGICAQYGLSLIRDNYDVYALKNVGSDRGFVVEYGKNMLSVERIEDISNVVTRIIPYGKDAKGNIVYLDGTKWVDSPRIDEYAMPRIMYLDCCAVATESKTMTLADVQKQLRTMAQAEFDNGCDQPELSMTVDFISLGDTEEYKQYRDLDKVYLYDRVTVKDKVRGYNYNAEVVAIRHNVLTGLLESITLGSIQKGAGMRKIATWQVPEVHGNNIRLESITPDKVASDFGATLDLSGNAGVGRTFFQVEQPEGGKEGDTWIKTGQSGGAWEDLLASGATWEELAAGTWDGQSKPTPPQTYVHDGNEWVLTSDEVELARHSAAIEVTQKQIELKANKDDPATGVENTAVLINAGGVRVKTGGTFTVDSGNFDLDSKGNMAAQNAYLSGQVFVDGHPALSTNDIVVSTNAPENPHEGMIWIKPDTSTSAQTTFSQRVPWDSRQSLSAYTKTGELSGVATEPVGERYTYRIKVPIYLREYSEMETGGTLHFEIATASGGAAVLAVERDVSVTTHGSGNRVIEFEATSDVWLGNNSKLYYTMYATRIYGMYLANVLNSSDSSASISVECIARSTSGAAGWRDCKVYSYA